MDIKMWGDCDVDCQCDGLITDKFHIEPTRSGGKRRRDANMSRADTLSPLARTALHRSPYYTPSERTVLGSIQNSPRRSGGKISRLLDDRRKFTSAMDKENVPDNFSHLRKDCKRKPATFQSKLRFQEEEKIEYRSTTRSGPSRSEATGLFRSETTDLFRSETTDLFRSEATDLFRSEATNLFRSETTDLFRSELQTSYANEAFEATAGFLRSETETKVYEAEIFQKQTAQKANLFRTDIEKSYYQSESQTDFFKSEKHFQRSSFYKSAMSAERTDGAGSSAERVPAECGHGLMKMKSLTSWTLAQIAADSPERSATPQKNLEELSSDSGYPPSGHKLSSPLHHDEGTLDFVHILPRAETYVPGNEPEDLDADFETLHDLEEEFETDNFDSCSKYEIISTDSPNIISRGRSARTITAKNLVFGAPIADTEQSTSFNSLRANPSATRMLNFDDEPSFEFTSPASVPRPTHASVSVKKALKFSETPKKNALRHEKSDSSIGSMSNASPVSTRPCERKLRLFNSESTNSVESGFASEVEDTFLFDALEQDTLSPKVANFGDLLSGQIKDALLPVTEESMDLCDGTPNRPTFFRSLSLNPDAAQLDKVRLSLFKSSLESPTEVKLRGFKRPEPPLAPTEEELEDGQTKRRKSNCEPLKRRPALQRALSENCASIMSALARSAQDPDLIGDFSQPFALPLTAGGHRDLKSISCDTLAGLLTGRYRGTVARYQVIDCRYPYEFAGGHIRGARNLYTRDHMLNLFRSELRPDTNQVETTQAARTLSEASQAGRTLSEASQAGRTLSEATQVGRTPSEATQAGKTPSEATQVGRTPSETTQAGRTLSEATQAEAARFEMTRADRTSPETMWAVSQTENTEVETTQAVTDWRESRVELNEGETADEGRSILIFHCEFSVERGPKLSRFLRSIDREANKDTYPYLRYPEIYLLHQGYSQFYLQHPNLCEPRAYTPMLHPGHKTDLIRFRAAGEAVPLQKSYSMDERRYKSRSRLPL